MNRRCVIVGAGEVCPGEIDAENAGLVIAADGGARALAAAGGIPGLFVGDFDSFSGELPPDVPVLRHCPEKDETDMALAAAEARARGFNELVLYGGLGGRLDHTLANIQLIAGLAEAGADARLVGCGITVRALRNGVLELPLRENGNVSVFSVSDISHGVTLRGLKYPLTDAELKNTFPLGVSNEFTGRPASVAVREGTLVIIC